MRGLYTDVILDTMQPIEAMKACLADLHSVILATDADDYFDTCSVEDSDEAGHKSYMFSIRPFDVLVIIKVEHVRKIDALENIDWRFVNDCLVRVDGSAPHETPPMIELVLSKIFRLHCAFPAVNFLHINCTNCGSNGWHCPEKTMESRCDVAAKLNICKHRLDYIRAKVTAARSIGEQFLLRDIIWVIAQFMCTILCAEMDQQFMVV